MRLSSETASQLPADIARPSYDRSAQKTGIVHFGLGAFHRAHQAWYTDLAMDAGESDWAITGVSMRSQSVPDQLNPQDGLYTLTERSGDTACTKLIGAVREVLFAPEQGEEVIERIASPDCHIVSFTVTEKGYARGETGLDLGKARASFYPLLATGLERRRERGLAGVTLLPCDNLADNGRVLGALMREWLSVEAPQLLDWFESECTTPSSMIDRIVPRSTEGDLKALETQLGMEDRGAVFTERFSQWVIEDNFAGPRPAWEAHGAQLVSDVAPYETAKLRMLNGAHSLLAYCGLRSGYEFVHEAVADAEIGALAEKVMREEAAPTIAPAPDQDLGAYAGRLLERFADPALRHRLSQIAMDGTQKIPQRWLDTALARMNEGQEASAIGEAFDAWLWHLEDGRFIDDPHGDELAGLVLSQGREAVIARCFGGGGAEPPLWPGYEALAAAFSN